jgi:hypothetical protein
MLLIFVLMLALTRFVGCDFMYEPLSLGFYRGLTPCLMEHVASSNVAYAELASLWDDCYALMPFMEPAVTPARACHSPAEILPALQSLHPSYLLQG